MVADPLRAIELGAKPHERYLLTCRLRLALGEGEWLPPLSESLEGAVTPSRGVGMVPGPVVSESLRLGQSRSESLGPTLLLL